MAIAQSLRTLLQAGRFQDTLELYRTVSENPDARRADVQLLAATAATRLGELTVAGALANEALRLFHGRGDRDGAMRALNLLGAIHWERGEMADAERCFSEALRLSRELKDSLMLARACNNLASVAHLQGRSADAAELYRAALLAYQRLGDRRGTAETYHNLGLVYRQAGGLLQADDAAAEAVRHAEVVGEPGLLALALTGRAELNIGRDEPAMAEHALERASRFAAAASDEIGGAEVHRVRALAALRQGKWELALNQANAAGRVAAKHDSVLLLAECAGIAARALLGMGRRKEAAEQRRVAAQRFQQLGATTLLESLEREFSS